MTGLLSGFASISAPVRWTFIGPRAPVPAGLDIENWIDFKAPIYSREEFRRHPGAAGASLLHFPHYNLPWTAAGPCVVTVHDLFHLRYGSAAKRLYQSFFLRRVAWSGALVVADSAKTSDDLRAAVSIAPERVRVVHLGPGRVPPGRARPAPASVTLADGRTLHPPWFLAAGIDQPHKNLDFLLSAVAMWRQRRAAAPPLVWVGGSRESVAKRLGALPAHARDRIFLEPYAPPEPLEKLYAGALALVFPSLDEGFGLPPLEAMARGVPVICSKRRPMTDLLGDAPLWFDPEASATLWRALDLMTDDPSAGEEASKRGLRQAALYDWRRTARETFLVYAEAAGRFDLLGEAARREAGAAAGRG